MKKRLIFTSVILAQLLVILFVSVYSRSNAVKWDVDGFKLKAQSVRGASDDEIKALNDEIEKYLTEFDKYNAENILYSHSFRVVSDTKNISVVEINTSLLHNMTEEAKEYTPAGEVCTELWVFVDNGKIKTNWVEKSNTAVKIDSESTPQSEDV